MSIAVQSRAVAFALVSLCAAGGADAAEFRGAAGNWSYDITGSAREAGRDYDFQRDLELGTGERRSVHLEWDTPRGPWPDLAGGYQRISAEGDHEETTTVTLAGIPVTSISRTIATRGDLTDTHLTARYPWRWGGLRLAGGLTLRRLAGDFRIEDSDVGQGEDGAYDQAFPQLHLQARAPLKDLLTLVAETDAVAWDGNRAVQWRAGAELRALAPLLLELSWQDKRYAVAVDDGDRLDARLSGGLLRLGILLR